MYGENKHSPSRQVAHFPAEPVHGFRYAHGSVASREVQFRHAKDFGIGPVAAKLAELSEERSPLLRTLNLEP